MRLTQFGRVIIGLSLCVSSAHAAELVANGGFETGALAPEWSVVGSGIGIDSSFPNNGSFDAFFSTPSTAPNPGALSQTLTTTPGQGYDLSFALLDEAGFSGDTFTVSFGSFSATIHGDHVAPPGDLPSFYTLESFAIPGTDISGASTVLRFGGVNAAPGGIAFNLDDVSVTVASSVPEPASLPLLTTALLALVALVSARRRLQQRG